MISKLRTGEGIRGLYVTEMDMGSRCLDAMLDPFAHSRIQGVLPISSG